MKKYRTLEQTESAQARAVRFAENEGFMRFAHASGWIDEEPTRRLKGPKVTYTPTMPYTQDEVIAMLAACAELPDNYGKVGAENGPSCSSCATAGCE